MWASILPFIKSIFSWKMLAVIVVGAVVSATIYYGLSLQKQVAEMESKYESVKQELVKTEEQAATDLAGYQQDVQAYESSINSIRASLVDAQVTRTRLEETLDEAETNDTSLQECFGKELPASVLDSLY